MGPFAKIGRNGEAFWVKDIRQLEPGVFVGVVDNSLMDERFALGSTIAFVEAEVKEVRTMPKLAIDNTK